MLRWRGRPSAAFFSQSNRSAEPVIAALQGDVGEFAQARQFAHVVRRLAAVAIFGIGDLHAEPFDLGEAGGDDIVDLDQEIIRPVRIGAN